MDLKVVASHDETSEVEVIEKKCAGHPDTLADGLAERLSCQYARYTRDKYGAVLHHNFDKVMLLGGRSHVALGQGYLTSPIRVLLNGRACSTFGGSAIPVVPMLIEWSQEYFRHRLPLIDPQRDLIFTNNLSEAPSPGAVAGEGEHDGARAHWFAPRSLDDLRERRRVTSNDTSLGAAHYPPSALESAIDQLGSFLAGDALVGRPWLGTDIKIMAIRQCESVGVTMCVPLIANEIRSLDEYRDGIADVRSLSTAHFGKALPDCSVSLELNTKDDFERVELYLTAIGSSIESGDEGVVGRGNRANGMISSLRAFSMEGVAGKNPVYHAGKIYNAAAQRMARLYFEETGRPATVVIIGQSGRDLADPWQVLLMSVDPEHATATHVVSHVLADLEGLTNDIVAGSVSLF